MGFAGVLVCSLSALLRNACHPSLFFCGAKKANDVLGGARRDRTVDLNTASVALSQLSYGPN
jgi:hypothetical protein